MSYSHGSYGAHRSYGGSFGGSASGGLRWTLIETTGKPPAPRGYHTANLVGNVMIVVGGSDGRECFSDVWCLHLGGLLTQCCGSPLLIAKCFWQILLLGPDSISNSLTDDFRTPLRKLEAISSLWADMMARRTGTMLSCLTLVSICLFDSVLTLTPSTAVTLQYEPRTVKGKPPSARGYHVTTIVDSRLFVFGGVSRFPSLCAFLNREVF